MKKIFMIVFFIFVLAVSTIIYDNYNEKNFCTTAHKCITIKGNWKEALKTPYSIVLFKKCILCKNNMLDIFFFDDKNIDIKIINEKILPFDRVGEIASLKLKNNNLFHDERYLINSHALISCLDFSCLNDIIKIN